MTSSIVWYEINDDDDDDRAKTKRVFQLLTMIHVSSRIYSIQEGDRECRMDGWLMGCIAINTTAGGVV